MDENADDFDVRLADIKKEIGIMRARLHNLNDFKQAHELALGEHKGRIGVLEESVRYLTGHMATRDQLDNAMTLLGNRMQAAADLVTLQIKTITDNLDPIRKAVYWVVGLVMSGVILAALAFLFRRPVL